MEAKSQERQLKSQELTASRQFMINTQVDAIEEQPSLLFGDDPGAEITEGINDSNTSIMSNRLSSPIRGKSLMENRPPIPWNEVKKTSLSFNGVSQSPIRFSSPERLEASSTFVDGTSPERILMRNETRQDSQSSDQIQVINDTQRINDTQTFERNMASTTDIRETEQFDKDRSTHKSTDLLMPSNDDDTQIVNIANDTQVIAMEPVSSPDMRHIRSHKQAGNEADTQVINTGVDETVTGPFNQTADTQPINPDTQIINADTQIINTDTQTINADIQAINTDTQIINTPSKADPTADTQIINQGAHSSHHAAQIIQPDTQPESQGASQGLFTADTQVIKPLQMPILSLVVSSPAIQHSTSPQRIQIPNTEARSRTQVINTQEDDLAEDTFLRHDFDRRSTKSRAFDDTEEIKSDEEEKDIEDVLLFDDSIPNHKRRLTSSDNEDESLKYARIDSGIDQLAGLSSFGRSSPSSDNRGSKVSQYKTDYDRKRLTSSPTKDQISSEITDLSQSVGDVKLDKAEDADDADIKTRKNRRNFVAGSQSQPSVIHEGLEQTESPKEALPVLRHEILEILTESQIINQTGVFALHNFKFYPGIITNDSDGDSLTVKFDEGDYRIKNSDLYLLDIRIGDKVRLRSTAVEYNVTGLAQEEAGGDISCIRGYNQVYLLKSKANKRSKELSVPLSECYMELSDFFRHQQVNQIIYDGTDVLKKNYFYFVEASTSNTEVQIEVSPRKQRPLLGAGTRVSPKKNQTIDKSGLFSGSLFFMTSIDDDKKEELKKIITDNGGVLIEEEIKDIFHYETVDDKRILLLKLLDGYKFTAILSSNYCRSAKYFQALALGWPILSSQWVEDVVKNVCQFSHWGVYLLPAGHSTHLGTVKSLDVHKFRANMDHYDVKDQLANNADLLQNYNILMVYNRNNNTTLETCEFIFHALGVNSLQIFNNFGDIKKYLANNKSTSNLLVYLEDDTKKLGKKIPLSRSNSLIQKLVETSDCIGLINWEWVVQCVISQYIWQPEEYITI